MPFPTSENFIVFTGGPGSGKSTLIAALVQRGFHTMPEAGRSIIQEQVAIGGSALPWADRAAFAELMLSWDIRSYRAAADLHGSVAFDRGVPDVAGYLRLSELPVPSSVEKAVEICRYHARVFIAPPWPAIFTHDAERKQSLEEAEATYRVLAETYAEAGYDLIHLPLASVEDRLKFVLSTLGTR